MPAKLADPAAHFWSRVAKAGAGECWEWQGCTNTTGYGTLSWGRKHAVAHRVAAYLSGLVDAVPSPRNRKGGGFVLHKCDNHLCCNPEHFETGTYRKNQRDAYSRKRRVQPRSKHANATFSEGEIRTIRADFAGGKSQGQIARAIGTSQSRISRIVRGLGYADVV